MRPTYGNLNVIGSGPVVAGQNGNDFLKIGFEVWQVHLSHLVSRNMLTKTASGTKDKWYTFVHGGGYMPSVLVTLLLARGDEHIGQHEKRLTVVRRRSVLVMS